MEEASLQQINIKTPEFMEMAVNGWFSILEAQFHLRNITVSTTKFYTVISSLPAEVVAKIPIRILESKKYEEIKQSLIEAHKRTKPELLDKLMSTTTITVHPSTYLQEMLSIAKRIGIGEEIVIHKFLQALPATIFPVIASQKELSPTQLGKLADELMTDPKPICGAFHSLKLAKSDRKQRQLAIITEFISDIAHVKGNQNVVADCLSRPTFAVQIDIYDLPALADAQKSDTEIQSFPDLKKFTLSWKDQFVLCDTSTSYPRPFVPCTLWKSIFDSLHVISHPGIKPSIKMIKARFYWPHMDKPSKNYVHHAHLVNKQKYTDIPNRLYKRWKYHQDSILYTLI